MIPRLDSVSSVCFSCMRVIGGVFDERKYRFFAVREEKKEEGVLLLSTVWAVLFPLRNQTALFCVRKGVSIIFEEVYP